MLIRKWEGVRSTIKPTWFWIRNIIDNKAIMRIRWNPKEIIVSDDDKTFHKEWQYDEAEVIQDIIKPTISDSEMEVKIKERYSRNDAYIVLSRTNKQCIEDTNSEKISTYTELKVIPEEWIEDMPTSISNKY